MCSSVKIFTSFTMRLLATCTSGLTVRLVFGTLKQLSNVCNLILIRLANLHVLPNLILLANLHVLPNLQCSCSSFFRLRRMPHAPVMSTTLANMLSGTVYVYLYFQTGCYIKNWFTVICYVLYAVSTH